MDQHTDGRPQYVHIEQNEFLHRKHKKQKEEDIATCDCIYNIDDPDSACGDRCLNFLTSTECTPGYCPSGSCCRNQRFQKCENAKSQLFKTEGRGWGLLADEDIKTGQFIIEYCGEVISCKEARRRSHDYEDQRLLDAYIISLNARESIDATKKGSLARFINHSCQPNCETRKWNVLGEIRVGIFAKQDIPVGTELTYNYNFEWYGGAKVRCLCGASCCSGFLGAKSRGFQEDTYLWEDDDDRYSVENIPTYDSEEDEPISKFIKPEPSRSDSNNNGRQDISMTLDEGRDPKEQLQSTTLVIEPPMEVMVMQAPKPEVEEEKLHENNPDQNLEQKNMDYRAFYKQAMSKKKSPSARSKQNANKEVNAERVGKLLASKEAQDEVKHFEEAKKQASARLDTVYNEIRPAIEEHEREHQDNVSTDVAEKWIEASCSKIKADFDLFSSIIKNITCNSRRPGGK